MEELKAWGSILILLLGMVYIVDYLFWGPHGPNDKRDDDDWRL